MKKRILGSIFLPFLLLGYVAIICVPLIDSYLNPGLKNPTQVTFLGTAVVVILLTTIFFYFALKMVGNLSRAFFIYVLTYNILLILVKFTLAPSSFYEENQRRVFSASIGSILNGSGRADIIMLTLSGVAIFALYYIAYNFIASYFTKKTKKALSTEDNRQQIIQGKKKIVGIFSLLIFLLVIVIAVYVYRFILLFLLLPASSAFSYLTYLASAPSSIYVFVGLIGVIIFATFAFDSAAKRAVMLRDATLLTTFLWVGAGFLFAFHGLWIVYMLVITSLWPLRVVTPK